MTRSTRWGHVPELAVLAAVLGIAALASYIHLRAVWEHAGAPVPDLGPLTVDGLFAAAWLRMRRRRRDGERVGGLAWLALGLALVATVAGNLAAAWISGHRDPLSLVVAAWPALAFAVVWELVTGHRAPTVLAGRTADRVNLANFPGDEHPAGTYEGGDAEPLTTAADRPEPDCAPADVPDRDDVAPAVPLHVADAGDRAGELIAAGYGRRRLAAALGIKEHEARALIEEAAG